MNRDPRKVMAPVDLNPAGAAVAPGQAVTLTTYGMLGVRNIAAFTEISGLNPDTVSLSCNMVDTITGNTIYAFGVGQQSYSPNTWSNGITVILTDQVQIVISAASGNSGTPTITSASLGAA